MFDVVHGLLVVRIDATDGSCFVWDLMTTMERVTGDVAEVTRDARRLTRRKVAFSLVVTSLM